MNQRLRIAIPLVLAAVLSALFVVMLMRQVDRADHEQPLTPKAPVAVAHGKDRTIPVGPVEAPRTAPKVVRHARDDGLHRWGLSEYPDGWDPEIAASIHAYFEKMADLEKNRRGLPLDDLREEVRNFLAGLGPEALPTLAAILDAEPDFVYRRFLLYAIGDLGRESDLATWILKDYLMARKDNPQAVSEVKHVIRAMGNLQNDTSFETLRELVWHPDPRMQSFRKDIIEQLGLHDRRAEAVDTMVEGLREDTLTSNRNKWAQALKRVADPTTLDDLYIAFNKERYWATKQTILGAIGGIGSPAAIPFLEDKARSDPTPAVRLSAARALWRIATPYALDLLQGIIEREKDAKMKQLMESWAEEKRE